MTAFDLAKKVALVKIAQMMEMQRVGAPVSPNEQVNELLAIIKMLKPKQDGPAEELPRTVTPAT